MNRNNLYNIHNNLKKVLVLALLVLVASLAFAASDSNVTVLRLRAVVAPQASFYADADNGQLSIAANNDAFQVSVHDQFGRQVEVEDGQVVAEAGQKLVFNVMAV